MQALSRLRERVRRSTSDPIEAWTWAPATRSFGSWLVCDRGTRLIAFAPPGVALDDTQRDDLNWWRRAEWRDAAAPSKDMIALVIVKLSTDDIERQVPADFRAWVISVTEDQHQALSWYVATAPGDGCDRHTKEARRTRDRLATELLSCGRATAMPARVPRVSSETSR